MSIPIIRSKNLSFDYIRTGDDGKETSFTALKDVSVSITRGEFAAVLGRNGSGKSTLAKHMNALLSPSGGEIWINGYDAKNEEFFWEIRRSAGMVFQNPDNQIIATTVEDDVAFGPENLGIEPKEIRERVDKSVEDVGMSEYMTQSPHFLSGGQKQRVAIAGILAMRPACIIFDEPTAMLDPIGRKEVIEAALKLNKQENITIILITHFMEEAVLADKVYVMGDGEIILYGTPEEVFSKTSYIRSVGLDAPQTVTLAELLNEMGMPVPVSLSVEGTISQLEKMLCK